MGFVEKHRGTDEILHIANLSVLYDRRAAALGHPGMKCHSNRLSEDIFAMVPDINAIQIGRGWSLVYNDDLSQAVAYIKDNTATEMSFLRRAAIILCGNNLSQTHEFTGTFCQTSEQESIPPMLGSTCHKL